MQQVCQGIGEALVQESLSRMGPGRLLLQAGKPFALEGTKGVVNRAHGTAQVAGDGRSTLAAGAGQQDLAASDGKGVGGAQSGLQLVPLGSRKSANEGRGFHTPLFASGCAQTRPRLPLH
jgi:hypothetical protein